ncbi:MAG: hypothetical protein ABIH24_08495 [Verrucomicrobiota bacterium]
MQSSRQYFGCGADRPPAYTYPQCYAQHCRRVAGRSPAGRQSVSRRIATAGAVMLAMVLSGWAAEPAAGARQQATDGGGQRSAVGDQQNSTIPAPEWKNKALLRIPRLGTPPVVDGRIDETEWGKAARWTNFLLTRNAAFAQEQTVLWIGYDDRQLYLAFRMQAFPLDPASNQGDAFLAKIPKTEKDKDVWSDDSVEFRLEATNAASRVNYYLAFNANGALLDMALKGADWDRGWDSGARVEARKDDKGFWEAEVSVPFSALNARPEDGALWRFSCARFEQRLKEVSSWTRLADGDHTNPESIGLIVLGGACPAARMQAFAEADFAKRTIPCAAVSPQTGTLAWESRLVSTGTPLARQQGLVALVTGETAFAVACPSAKTDGTGSATFAFQLSDPRHGALLESPAYPFSQGGGMAHFRLRAADTDMADVFWNGLPVATEPTNRLSVEAEMEFCPGVNVLAVRCRGKGRIAGEFEHNGAFFKTDASWKTARSPRAGWEKAVYDDSDWTPARIAEGDTLLGDCPVLAGPDGAEGEAVFRKVFLYRATELYPLCTDDIFHLTQGGTYYLQWDGTGAVGWNLDRALEDWRLILEVPEGLEFLGATGRKEWVTAQTERYGPEAQRKKLPFAIYTWRETGRVRQDGRASRVYEIRRNEPVTPVESLTWGPAQKYRQAGCHIAMRATAKSGDALLPIRFRCEAFGGAFQEMWRTRHCRILPRLDGRQPKEIVLFLMAHDAWLQEEGPLRRNLETIRTAGVSEMFGPFQSALPRKAGLGQTYFFNLDIVTQDGYPPHMGIIDVGPLVERFPEARAVSFEGKPAGNACLSYLARHPETWPFLEAEIADLKRRCPSLTHLFWDYEFGPFPGRHRGYPCFSPFGIATFAKEYNIAEPLTPALLKEKYNKEWVEFVCGEMAAVSGVLRDICHKQGLKMTVYSGYECWDTHWMYGVNWNRLGPNVDRGYCGYGRSSELIAATRKGLAGKPLVGGLLKMGDKAQYHEPAQLMRMVVDCGGGVLCWYQSRWDGKALQSFAYASRAIAEYEDILLHGTRCDGDVSVGGAPPDNVVAYERDGRLLVLVLNERQEDLKVDLWLRKPGGRLKEFYTGQKFDADKRITLTVPGGKFLALAGTAGTDEKPLPEGKAWIPDPSFEAVDAQGRLTDWTSVYGGYALADKARTGKRALKLSCTEEADQSGRLGVARTFSGFAPGSRFLVTSHVFIEEFRSGIIKPVHFSFTGGGKTQYPQINLLPGQAETGKWLCYDYVLDLSAYPETDQVQLWCLTWNHDKKPFVGTVYFDDVTVRQLE